MTTPTKRSAKARKARLMYVNNAWKEDGASLCAHASKRAAVPSMCRPVFLLPAAPEDVERMREAVAKALWDLRRASAPSFWVKWPKVAASAQGICRAQAAAALTALGLTPPPRRLKHYEH
jgi:hypothetical protein